MSRAVRIQQPLQTTKVPSFISPPLHKEALQGVMQSSNERVLYLYKHQSSNERVLYLYKQTVGLPGGMVDMEVIWIDQVAD